MILKDYVIYRTANPITDTLTLTLINYVYSFLKQLDIVHVYILVISIDDLTLKGCTFQDCA